MTSPLHFGLVHFPVSLACLCSISRLIKADRLFPGQVSPTANHVNLGFNRASVLGFCAQTSLTLFSKLFVKFSYFTSLLRPMSWHSYFPGRFSLGCVCILGSPWESPVCIRLLLGRTFRKHGWELWFDD